VGWTSNSFPDESDFVQKSLSIESEFVIDMIAPLIANPLPKRCVILVAIWHHTMSSLSFKLDHLFIVLVPELVVWFEGVVGVRFPSEPDFVQNSLPILSNFVLFLISPLRTKPVAKSLVLLVPSWHHTMAILQFKLDELHFLSYFAMAPKRHF
jgi:hypothetical protein